MERGVVPPMKEGGLREVPDYSGIAREVLRKLRLGKIPNFREYLVSLNDVQLKHVGSIVSKDLRKVYGETAAYDEWASHLPLSLFDLIGIKTYESKLPYNMQPSYLFWPQSKHPSLLELI